MDKPLIQDREAYGARISGDGPCPGNPGDPKGSPLAIWLLLVFFLLLLGLFVGFCLYGMCMCK